MNYYDNQVTPTDTGISTYDDNKHRYTLTIQAVDDEFNVSLLKFAGDEENAESLLREVSADLYKYIYRYNRRGEVKRRIVEHMLAKNGDLRSTIDDSMLDMVRALIRGGYSMIKDLARVNPITGLTLDMTNVPSIAPDATEGLLASGILFKGEYNYRILDEDYRSDY